MRTLKQVKRWIEGAIDNFGDPSAPTGVIFARFVTQPTRNEELVLAAWHERKLHIDFGGGWLPVPIDVDGPVIDEERGSISAWGIEKICPGLWTLSPSIHMPGIIHVFAHSYCVPSPAPWESMIITATVIPRNLAGVR